MTQSSLVAALFDKKFNMITTEIPYDPAWNNNTGYFDNAVEGPNAVILEPTMEAKSTTDNNRKLIFIGTVLGTIVVFQRYSGRSDVIVTNQTKALHSTYLIPFGSIDYDTLVNVVGNGYSVESNVGYWINNIAQTLSKGVV